jgi:hypothetical protein
MYLQQINRNAVPDSAHVHTDIYPLVSPIFPMNTLAAFTSELKAYLKGVSR